MLLLSLPKEAGWIDIGNGAALFAAPPTAALVFAARGRADMLLLALDAGEEAVTLAGGAVEGLPDLMRPEDRRGLHNALFALSLAEIAVSDWRGIGDDAGNELAFDVRLLAELMRQPQVAETWQARYLQVLNLVSAEKNA